MDSMALYREMDICTAKPSAVDRQQVRHHLIDVLDPDQTASVSWWLEEARASVCEIESRGKRVLFVGGTPLYLQALLFGLFDGPPADESLRLRLEQLPGTELHRALTEVDPVSAARLHPNDVRRLVRAVEVFELTGRPISQWQQQWDRPTASEPPRDGIAPEDRCLVFTRDRQELYRRIDSRVLDMLEDGLVDEVRRLRARPGGLSRAARQALGVEELAGFLEGRDDLASATARVQQASRNFAKRQLTWFRRISACKPVTEDLTFARWGLTIE